MCLINNNEYRKKIIKSLERKLKKIERILCVTTAFKKFYSDAICKWKMCKINE